MMKMIEILRKPSSLVAAVFLMFSAVMSSTEYANARIEIDITKGNVEPLPIAIPSFLGNNQLARDIADVVSADLKRSGLFAPMDRAGFVQQISDSNATPRFGDWQAIQAQALVVGQVVEELVDEVQRVADVDNELVGLRQENLIHVAHYQHLGLLQSSAQVGKVNVVIEGYETDAQALV